MTVRKNYEEKEVMYFCTFTCYSWLPLIEHTDFYDEIYKWFGILRKGKIEISGYVIMPNHVHALIYVPEGTKSINQIIGTGKRFMAYEIVRRLEKNKEYSLLKQLAEGVDENEKRKGKLHQVFEPSFDGKICDSKMMIEQKLDYMHHNPVSGKWNLVSDYVEYKHSSASFYETGKRGIFEVKHYKDINYAESPSGDSAAR